MRDTDANESISRATMSAFLLISFGYMLPWTALGSLISYYKETFGKDFYVKIYCLYYLPGLPIALIQYQYDEHFDVWLGSRKAYLMRGVGCFTVMIIVLFTMIGVQNEYFLLFGFMVLGICGWLCHGTASMLAAMYPSSAIASLQIGFRIPEIFSLAATYLLSLDKNASALHLRIFYGVTGSVVMASLVCWVMLVRSRTARVYFSAKDSLLRTYSQASLNSTTGETESLLSNYNHASGKARSCYTLAADANDFTSEEEGDAEEQENDHTCNTDEITPRAECKKNNLCTWLGCQAISTTPDVVGVDESNPGLCAACAACSAAEGPTCYTCTASDNTASRNANHFFFFSPLSLSTAASSSALPSYSVLLPRSASPPHDYYRGSRTLRGLRKGQQTCSIAPLCAALMITIWSSIFQAAFFAYVNSPRDRNIEQTLYFVRLFADLLGRPLTFLPRPYFIKVFYTNVLLCIM